MMKKNKKTKQKMKPQAIFQNYGILANKGNFLIAFRDENRKI